MKDGVAMSHTDNVLRIEQVRREDKGMYQCFVRNDQESAQASAELKLGGRCKSYFLFKQLYSPSVPDIGYHPFFFLFLLQSIRLSS